MSADGTEDWLYHLPEFLDRVRERDAHGVRAELDLDLGGVLYHHRGTRLPAYDATFLWRGDHDRFELDLDVVGARGAWAAFDATRSWDFYLFRVGGDQPCLCWMADAEFREEEADEFDAKSDAAGLGRFSFGLYLHAPRTWEDVETQFRETDAPVLVSQPDGRTYVPQETELEAFAEALPEELRPNGDTPPDHLGVVDADVDVR